MKNPFEYGGVIGDLVKSLVEIFLSDSFLNSSCRRLYLPTFCLLRINSGHHLLDARVSLDPFESLFTVKQHRSQPALRHPTPTKPLEVPFTVPDGGEHAFNGIGGVQRLSQ